MLTIDVKADVDKIKKELLILAKDQIPFATAKALTETAKRVKEAIVKEMEHVFHNPTPYTLKSLFIVPAKKNSLIAKIEFKQPRGKATAADKYLRAEIYAGGRAAKRFELSLRANGLLPKDLYAVPGAGADIDEYGNMPRSQIQTIIKALKKEKQKAPRKTRAGTKNKPKKDDYFAGKPNGKAPAGIWQRLGNYKIIPVIIYVRQPRYKKRLDFYGVGQKAINQNLEKEFIKAINFAMSTKR